MILDTGGWVYNASRKYLTMMCMCKNIRSDQSLDCCSDFMKVVIPAIHKLYSVIAITNNVCNCTTWPFFLFSGWAYIALIACTVLIFMIGMLSIKADKATSKDEIEDEILEGKHLICVKWEARYSCYIYIFFLLNQNLNSQHVAAMFLNQHSLLTCCEF